MKTIREQLDECRHLTGIGGRKDGSMISLMDRKRERGQCEAGVYYEDVRKQGARMSALPCFHPEPDNMPDDGVWPTCEQCSFKTKQELDAEVEEHNETTRRLFIRYDKARTAIVEHARPERGQGYAGDIPCPVCEKGKLHYTISGYNGHIHAACTTPDCVRWME